NFLPPYRLPLMHELLNRCTSLQVLVSTPMESERHWPAQWPGLPVEVQKSLHWPKTWRHRHRFQQSVTVHFPYDTVARLNSFRPNVVISAEFGARTAQAALYRLFFLKSRLIIWATVSEITEADRGRFRRQLRRLLLARADAVIVNGNSGARYIRAFGVASEKVFRVPQTTSIQPFLDLPIPTVAPPVRRLLYSGRLVEFKGVVPFLLQLREWATKRPSQEIEVTFAGDGPVRTEIRAMALPTNLRLRFLGNLPYADLPEVYGSVDVLIFPTLADEWGLVVVEAMAAGLPVLGSLYSQAVEDLVIDNETGWTFRTDHPKEMSGALDRMLSTSPAALLDMKRRARESVRHLTPARMAQDMEAALTYVRTHGT
ncbi:MAG: glycosyltransferase family 4 protein, partial [Acidobacteriota bacterium]